MSGKDYFIPKMFYRLVVPSVISSFGFALADMADALVVGQKLGETGLAAISLCLPIFMLINLFMDGLGVGGSVLFSQRLGEGKTEEARECFNRTWTVTLTLGVIIGIAVNAFNEPCLRLLGTDKTDGDVYYACRDYATFIAAGAPILMLNVVFGSFLRNDNNVKLALNGFLIGTAVDILLNIILVLFCDLGTRGAALSTVIGSTVAVIIYIPGIMGKRTDVLGIKKFRLDIVETLCSFKIGFATSVRYLFQFIFFLFINRLLMTMSGESGVAVFDVVYNASFFIVYLYNGIAEALQPLVSTFTGEKNEGDCRCVWKLSKKTAICFGAAAAMLIVLNTEKISLVFGISENLIPDSTAAIRVYCIGFVFLGMNIINEKYYQSRECFLPTFFIVLMREFVILISCAAILSRIGFSAIWFMYPITETVTYLIFHIFRRFIDKQTGTFDEKRIFRMIVSDVGDMEKVLSGSGEFCKYWGADAKREYAVTLVTEELCMSIIRNAIKDIRGGKIRVTLLALKNGEFVLSILDNAVEFNPFLFAIRRMENENDFNIDEISMTMIKNKTKKFMHHKCGGFNSLVVRI